MHGAGTMRGKTVELLQREGNGQLFYRCSAASKPGLPTLKGLETQRYTCIGKGGVYHLIGTVRSLEPGPEDVVAYVDAVSGVAYFRSVEDFRLRMEAV